VATWLREACDAYGFDYYSARVAWRVQTVDQEGRSCGATYIGARMIVVAAGTDEWDQALVFLHEVAHLVTQQQHTKRMWQVAFELYERFGFDIELAYARERYYKKKAAAAAASLGSREALLDVHARRLLSETAKVLPCEAVRGHNWCPVEGVEALMIKQVTGTTYRAYRFEACSRCRAVTWTWRKRLSTWKWDPWEGEARGSGRARFKVQDLKISATDALKLFTRGNIDKALTLPQ